MPKLINRTPGIKNVRNWTITKATMLNVLANFRLEFAVRAATPVRDKGTMSHNKPHSLGLMAGLTKKAE
jgi:hypothetical protein